MTSERQRLTGSICSEREICLAGSVTIAGWLECLGGHRGCAMEQLAVISKHAASSRVHRRAEREEVASDLLLELMKTDFETLRKAPPELPLGAWAIGVASKLVLRQVSAGARRREIENRKSGVRPHDASVNLASMEDRELDAATSRLVLAAADKLPPPYRQIILWQRIDGLTRRQIAACLAVWHSTGSNRCRTYITRAHTMFKAAFFGEDLRKCWPRRFSEKNAWNGIPPPIPD